MSDLIHKSQIYELLGQSGKKDIHVSDIDLLPTVDAVPVVRCKECVQHNTSNPMTYYVDGVHTRYCRCEILGRLVKDDSFCSFGKRKVGDT